MAGHVLRSAGPRQASSGAATPNARGHNLQSGAPRRAARPPRRRTRAAPARVRAHARGGVRRRVRRLGWLADRGKASPPPGRLARSRRRRPVALEDRGRQVLGLLRGEAGRGHGGAAAPNAALRLAAHVLHAAAGGGGAGAGVVAPGARRRMYTLPRRVGRQCTCGALACAAALGTCVRGSHLSAARAPAPAPAAASSEMRAASGPARAAIAAETIREAARSARKARRDMGAAFGTGLGAQITVTKRRGLYFNRILAGLAQSR